MIFNQDEKSSKAEMGMISFVCGSYGNLISEDIEV